MVKVPVVHKILKFLSGLFARAAKRIDTKAKVNFKIYDATNWEKINYNTDIVQYLTKLRQPDNKNWSDNRR